MAVTFTAWAIRREIKNSQVIHEPAFMENAIGIPLILSLKSDAENIIFRSDISDEVMLKPEEVIVTINNMEEARKKGLVK